MIAAVRPLALAGLLAGCGDVVIGSFALGTDGTDTTEGSDTAASSTGADAVPLPGGCVELPFDGSEDPAVWLTWAEGDAATTITGGTLALRPASAAEQSTGLVLVDREAFRFSDASVRVQVVTPPDPASTTELFLQVTQQAPATQAVISFALFQGNARVRGVAADGTLAWAEQVAAGYPAWIGLRVQDGRVVFETATDGDDWVAVASYDLPATFDGATPLVMTWNNPGDVIAPQTVEVDALRVCAQ
ncbi:MAG: hypothetical protein K1X88_21990 [Nannocystaceae bacterium]|nr:hypothetical protein [Nannocystaceae bacterium]